MKKINKRDYSIHPKFVPWPKRFIESVERGDTAIEDPVAIAIYFQQYLYHHFRDYRRFLLDGMKAMGPLLDSYKAKDLPPFLPELFDEIERGNQ